MARTTKQTNGFTPGTAVQSSFDPLFHQPVTPEPQVPAVRSAVSSVPVIYEARKHAAVRTDEYLYNQLIPYIGNKRKLLGLIAAAIDRTSSRGGIFVDFFAGSSVVARLAKTLGFRVLANDWEPYAQVISQCCIECNTVPDFAQLGGPARAFMTLNHVAPIEGYVATHLCPKDDDHPDHDLERMFFTHANGSKIDALREQIAVWRAEGQLTAVEQAVLLAAMMYAVSYVSNTSGVFKGFHRGWGGNTQTALYRILSNIELRLPVFYDNQQCNESYRMDAQMLAAKLRKTDTPVDIAYLDPPYNQHPYGSNYHVLNTVALWDKPELSPFISGRDKAAIRLDWRTERRSAYNHQGEALPAYDSLLRTIQARYILTSYSTDGNIPLQEMIRCAAQRGAVSCVKNAYKRYRVSSQRMSLKPMNVEFVLIIDTSARSTITDADRLYHEILHLEENALATHRENQTDSTDPMFGDV
ncbi:MAG: DNA adenine methylase [Chloroflexota bacterium]|nr:DNA adenine methylase [Chloroflexota bacterium]